MKLSMFNIANFKVDGGAMFGVIPKAMWSRVYPADENNLITLPLRSLVVETGDHVILVDTGWGSKQDERFFRYTYIHGGEGLFEGLRSRGYSPGDITDVVLTHLHADHCGGAFNRSTGSPGYKPAFPNAVIHVTRSQLEWALAGNPREEDSYPADNIRPIAGYPGLNLVEGDCELFEGFSVRICNGHTPGLMIPVISYNTKTIVYTGDLIPSVAHIPLLWNMSYDIESLKTITEKGRLLREALENNYILVFQHDEAVECCTLHMTPKGIRAREKFGFSEIA
jgi:glyoxylase-like metal-dependent hydrolase (beta-lactamase superfamily II)